MPPDQIDHEPAPGDGDAEAGRPGVPAVEDGAPAGDDAPRSALASRIDAMMESVDDSQEIELTGTHDVSPEEPAQDVSPEEPAQDVSPEEPGFVSPEEPGFVSPEELAQDPDERPTSVREPGGDGYEPPTSVREPVASAGGGDEIPLEDVDSLEEISADDMEQTNDIRRPVLPDGPRLAPRPASPSRPVIVVPPPVQRGAPPPLPPPGRVSSGRMPAIPSAVPPLPPVRPPSVGKLPAIPTAAAPRPVVRVPPIAGASAPAMPAVVRDALGDDVEEIPLETNSGVIDITDSPESAERAERLSDDPAIDPPPIPGSPLGDAGADDADEPSQAVVAADVAIESQLETPTALEHALAAISDTGHERRAEELTADVDRATAAGADKATIAGLSYELGELYERRLADEARAVKAFGKALSTDPSLRPNLWAIRRIFYRRGLWPNLQKLLDAELRFARTDADRADLLFEKGLLMRDRLDQQAEALAAFEESSRLDPRLLPPLLALERMALADGDLARAAVLWERLAVAARTPERKLLHLLDLVRHHAADGGPAALDRARELIAEAVALGVDGERVAEERLRLAELSGDPDEILAALESQAVLLTAAAGPAGIPAGTTARSPGTPLDRATGLRLRLAALRRRQAQVARTARRGERAWDYLQQALTAAPGEPLLLADLADLAEELGRFEELAELVQSWQSLEGDPSRAVTLSIRRADALLRGGQREAARALLTTLEAATPGLLPLTALVERDALVSRDWAALAAAWTRSAEAARLGTLLGATARTGSSGEPFGSGAAGAGPDPHLAASLYVAAAEVWSHDVGRPSHPDEGSPDGDAEARLCLGHALEVLRGYPPAIEALVDLHERGGRIDDAAAVLELQAESPASSDVEARVSVLSRLVRLYRDHGHYEQALGAEQRLRKLLPDDVRLMWQLDVSLAQLGRSEDRIQNLAAIASRDPDPARKGIALATAARLAEDAGDRDRAIDLYRQVLVAWPSERYARAALVELLRAQERWNDLVTQRRAEAAELSDGPGVVRALREAAWVLEERLARPVEAAQVYRELLDRVPDEPHAALGLVRCRAATGDALGLVAALEARLESLAGESPSARAAAAVSLAMAHEAAGHTDEAVETYRRALAALEGDPGAARSAAAMAAIALADVATVRGDTPGRAEAYTALIVATSSPRIAAALHEDLGWVHALVLEDFDRAAEAFEAASSTLAAGEVPGRGPLLGRLLVAARRSDGAGLAAAAVALAEVSSMPEAAAALYLRAAGLMSATPGNDGTSAAAAVARARAVAPDDVGALVVAAEYAPPAAAPPRTGDDIALSVDQLLARAEVFALRAQLADDPVARASWDLDRAEALEAAGRLKEAGGVVASVLRVQPADFRALEALRRLARRGGDTGTFARATVALARHMRDPVGRAELLREAVEVFDPSRAASPSAPGVDADAAVAIYKRILADDPGASDFDRLVTLYRGAGDIRGLHLAIDERVAWIDRTDGPAAAAVPLLLERARLRKGLANPRGAVADLDNLLRRDPGHAEALRTCAELVVSLGEAPRSVELWRRYLMVERDPNRRATGELALARVLAEDMGDTAGAIVQIERVLAATPDDAPLRERLIGLATRENDWQRVAREVRELARLRTSPGDKAREELRLAEVQRDRLSDKPGARATLARARAYDPLNLEIIGQLVQITDAGPERNSLLGQIADELRAAIEQAPARPALYERLGAVAGWQRDSDTAYWAALAVEALGTPAAEHRQIAAAGRAALPNLSRHLIDPGRRALLRPASVSSAAGAVCGDLWRAVAAAVTTAQALDPAKLGCARGDRVALKSLTKRFDALAAVLGMFGLEDVEIYVSEQRTGMARVLSGETPILCLGADIASGAAPQARYWLGRSAMLAADATGTLAELKEAEVAWFLASAVRAIEAPVPPGLGEAVSQDGAAVTERTRLLQKHLGRRDKKTIAALVPRLGVLGRPDDIIEWRRGALIAAHRAGLLCAGDLAPVLAAIDIGGARAIADAPHAADLLSWSVSIGHLELRRQLGYAGGRS